jgi:hypothetical protein
MTKQENNPLLNTQNYDPSCGIRNDELHLTNGSIQNGERSGPDREYVTGGGNDNVHGNNNLCCGISASSSRVSDVEYKSLRSNRNPLNTIPSAAATLCDDEPGIPNSSSKMMWRTQLICLVNDISVRVSGRISLTYIKHTIPKHSNPIGRY